MVQHFHHFNFVTDAAGGSRVTIEILGLDHFNCDLPVQPEVPGQVHNSCVSVAKVLKQLVVFIKYSRISGLLHFSGMCRLILICME